MVVGAATTLYLRRIGTIAYPAPVVNDARERDSSAVVFGVVFAMTVTHLLQVGAPDGVLLAAVAVVCALAVSAVHRWCSTPS